MGRTLKIGLAAAASLTMAGCAGIPVAVTMASLYVDSVLVLRTNKGATEHIVSAAAGQDCGLLNLLNESRLCLDEPPPQLLALLTREVQNVAPGAATASVTPTTKPQPAPLPAPLPAPVQLASAPSAGITDAGVPAGPLPEPKPRTALRTVAAVNTPPAVREKPAVESRTTSLMVVLGSFTSREQAERHRNTLGRSDVEIVEAHVFGRERHRVVLRPADRDGAMRELRTARAGGIGDAWLLADPRTGTPTGVVGVLTAQILETLL
ncbi:hypothetical protein HL658_01850 [Azospirillum sp. RWY-5-1]|uniref:SPOR domain-containing protein n=1 Tax=Azospirillum oleiclasticum TaxID=2735135 RepID=A0ABX2T700_9PROT|nr:hypothetical protein [Azospirillum oleiclasticum]NYZ11279.1 hypothetical protein [Azospirillum oleiclasticum]NYZ18440.1 hypothetical protein [Azospirillum oleiclasticum]